MTNHCGQLCYTYALFPEILDFFIDNCIVLKNLLNAYARMVDHLKQLSMFAWMVGDIIFVQSEYN